MTNLLKDSMDNIFISSADILDKLTYKLSSATTSTVIPHNNDSLLKPLTDVLKGDFEAYNRVLDNYNLELLGAESMLTYMKVKMKKEAELQQKMETERVKKEKEEAKRKAAVKAKQEAEKKRNEEAAAAAAAAAKKQLEGQKKQQEMAAAKEFSGNNDDFMLDLDLDGFNLNQQGQADNAMLQFDGSTAAQQKPAGSMGVPPAGNMGVQPAGQSSENALNGNPNDNMNDLSQTAGMDSLNDLNLDFLDTSGGLDDNQGGNLGADALGTGNDDLGLLGSLGGLNSGTGSSGMGSSNTGNINNGAGNAQSATNPGKSQEDDNSLMAPDQMENLFSQFDELVGGGNGGGM
ncbi:DEBR0S1_19966g1_1 [Brettanomyces bruxellensis]|uniref:DEBR0S1_19966g1_1 n=1 Tax=Dekkera bruxellensis TaxID=5007 RepID=A0A7D9H260_DEKBR|nr:DEBR0S1_19966g1_1 [Brettanomyces bruxellensis]